MIVPLPEADRSVVDHDDAGAAGGQRAAAFDTAERGRVKRLQNVLHANPTAVPAIVLIFSLIVFGAIDGGRFFQPFNFSLVLQQVTVIGIVGVAQTLVILTAGID